MKFFTYRTGIYDLVIFDQAIRGYSRFTVPGSYVKDQWNQLGEAVSILGDHFSPILATLAPLYWIYDGPQTLIVAQAVLFAAAAPFLWVFTYRKFGRGCAYFVSMAYLLSWPIAEAVAFHFHEYAFMPVLTAVLFERMQAAKPWHVVVVTLLILLVKEDIGFFVMGLGLALLWKREWRWMGVSFIGLGPVAVWATSQVLIPAFGGASDRYWYYSELGGSPKAAVIHMLTDPMNALELLFTPSAKVATLVLLLAPLLFLSLASPYFFAPMMLLLERMLASDQPGWWDTHYHYNSAIIVALLCAAVDGAERLIRCASQRMPQLGGKRRLGLIWGAASFSCTLAFVPFFALGNLLSPSWYQKTERDHAADAAIALVPDGILVEAANQLGPNLSSRTKVVIWREMPRRAPWVIADIHSPQPMFPSLKEQWEDIENLQRNGYRILFWREGYVVLHRD
uniref:DUF2079 domain-containing protein n=1 Tax=Microbispora cellulosiformans TaxID=2614688 RepID=UPI001787392B|nr:DUF2079 domain-containing protein [Microbispora cellulosiformans]